MNSWFVPQRDHYVAVPLVLPTVCSAHQIAKIASIAKIAEIENPKSLKTQKPLNTEERRKQRKGELF
jgi:hypothetical protein